MQIQQQSRGLKIIRAVILYMKQQRGYDKQKILDLEMAVNDYQIESKAMMDRVFFVLIERLNKILEIIPYYWIKTKKWWRN